MARLESIDFSPHRPTITDHVTWEVDQSARKIEGLPQIFWNDGTPWRAVNHWARERAVSGGIDIKTVQSTMRHLHAYAIFLEKNDIDWRHFPALKEQRCLVKWRKALIEARKDGVISPSTTSQRMIACIQFYRHAAVNGWVDRDAPKWIDRPVIVKYFDSVGFERTMQKISTDLSIPNRARPGLRLEDGLLPISGTHMNELLEFTSSNASEELHLMLNCGFFTGARIQSITDLRVQTLDHATPEPKAPGMWRLSVGPGASPPIATKFGVTGQLYIPESLLEALKNYSRGVRRLKRESLALPENKNLVFLTRFGNAYAERGIDKSAAINHEMASLRKTSVAANLVFMRKFHFHQTRATFGTSLMEIALNVGDPISAIAFVRDAMLHKEEATTWKYIKFIKETAIKVEVANAFTEVFLGIKNFKKAP